MIKKYLGIMIIGLTVAFSLTGCGGEGKTANVSGNLPSIAYTEKEMKLNQLQRVSSAVLDFQDRLVLYDDMSRKSKFVLVDKQGKEIRQIPCPAEADDNDYVDGKVFALGRNGKLYQLQQIEVYEKPNAEQPLEFVRRLQIYNLDGKKEKTVELGTTSGGNMDRMASSMQMDSRGLLYILHYGGNIEVIDQAGKPIKNITGAKYSYMDINERDELLVISRSDDGFTLCKINRSGKTIWKHKLDQVKKHIMEFTYNPYDKCCYIVDYSGIKKYDAEGNFKGEILNYRSTSIFASDVFINGLNFDAAGIMYISLTYNGTSPNGQQFSVFKYIPGKASQSVKQQKVLVVGTASDDMEILEKAARLYEKQNPAVRVEIKEYIQDRNMDSSDSSDRYVKALNTEILSGKGPDIIAVKGLPYHKYIEKKVFVDLNELIKKDRSFKRSDFYGSILKACENKGKLYALPVSFALPVLVADGSMFEEAGVTVNDADWNWSDFHRAAGKVSRDKNNDGTLDTYALPDLGPGELLDYMLAADYRTLVDEDKKQAHFDSAYFIRFLNNYKDLVSRYTNTRMGSDDLIIQGSRSSFAMITDQSFSGDMTIEKNIMGEKARVLAMPRGQGRKDRCFEAELYGVNRNSDLQEEAWDFLKFLINTKQQSTLDYYGIRINKNAQDKWFAKQAKNESSWLTFSNGSSTKTMKVYPLTPEQIKRTRELIAQLNHCSSIDPRVEKLFDSEVSAFIKGEKSAAETARILQTKVTLYLNE